MRQILGSSQFVVIFKDACQNFDPYLNLMRVDPPKAYNQTLRFEGRQGKSAQRGGGDIEMFGCLRNFNF
jgi:hypothetical protein